MLVKRVCNFIDEAVEAALKTPNYECNDEYISIEALFWRIRDAAVLRD